MYYTVFPLREPSRFNPDAPLLTDREIDAFAADPTLRAAMGRSLERFLAGRLRLTVNRAKSAVDRPWKRAFLGYGMTAHREPRLRIADKSVVRLRDKLRSLFRQGRGHTAADLAPILRGWTAYFRLAQVTQPD